MEAQWIGTNGAAFARVSAAFASIGLTAPKADTNSSGAYAMNIAEQYLADLSRHEAMAVIRFGLQNSLTYIQSCTPQSLQAVLMTYGE